MKGRPRSAETRARISAALRGKSKTEEHRRKLAAASTGQVRSDASRLAQRASWQAKSREERLRLTAPGRATAHPELHQTGEGLKRWWNSLNDSQKASAITNREIKKRRQWEALTPKERRIRTAPGLALATRASRQAHPTSIECIVAAVLDALGIAYVQEATIGRFTVDLLIPDRKLIIECDGEYWHSLPGAKARDRARDEWLNARGYIVLRLFERSIRKGAAAGAIVAALRMVA